MGDIFISVKWFPDEVVEVNERSQFRFDGFVALLHGGYGHFIQTLNINVFTFGELAVKEMDAVKAYFSGFLNKPFDAADIFCGSNADVYLALPCGQELSL